MTIKLSLSPSLIAKHISFWEFLLFIMKRVVLCNASEQNSFFKTIPQMIESHHINIRLEHCDQSNIIIKFIYKVFSKFSFLLLLYIVIFLLYLWYLIHLVFNQFCTQFPVLDRRWCLGNFNILCEYRKQILIITSFIA